MNGRQLAIPALPRRCEAWGGQRLEVQNKVTGEARSSCRDPLSWQWIAPLALAANLAVGYCGCRAADLAAALRARCAALTGLGGGARREQQWRQMAEPPQPDVELVTSRTERK